MKKTATLLTVLALVAPMALAVPASASTTATATKATTTKSTTYTVLSRKTFTKAKTVHTKDASVKVYKGAVAADRPTITLKANGKLKASTTFKVTQQIKVKVNAKKSQTYSYVKGHGWVLASQLTSGQFKQADRVTTAKSTTYTIVSATTLKKAKTVHTKDATPVVYKAAIAADQPKMTLTANGKLKAGTTFKVTKQAKLKKSGKTSTFSYVKGHGWVLASQLTAGQFKQAD